MLIIKPAHVCLLFLNKLLEAEHQVAELEGKVKELDDCLATTNSQLKEKDSYLEEQKRRERDLLTTITEYVYSSL